MAFHCFVNLVPFSPLLRCLRRPSSFLFILLFQTISISLLVTGLRSLIGSSSFLFSFPDYPYLTFLFFYLLLNDNSLLKTTFATSPLPHYTLTLFPYLPLSPTFSHVMVLPFLIPRPVHDPPRSLSQLPAPFLLPLFSLSVISPIFFTGRCMA